MRSLLLVPMLLVAACGEPAHELAEPGPATIGGWRYRWGDSPRVGAGVPAWTLEPLTARGWTALEGRGTPPGRARGDTCLQRVAATLAEQVRRAGDTVARYGGEEFAVLMPGTSREGARAVAEKLRAAVEAQQLAHDFSSVSEYVTISVGAASLTPDAITPAVRLVEQADAALYRAKREGRNRICVDGESG